jgi:hypothetical protein
VIGLEEAVRKITSCRPRSSASRAAASWRRAAAPTSRSIGPLAIVLRSKPHACGRHPVRRRQRVVVVSKASRPPFARTVLTPEAPPEKK